MNIERFKGNPILTPDDNKDWESLATFNPSVASDGNITHLVYRAISPKQKVGDVDLELSTIGHAVSNDGVTFTNREQLIKPEFDWEKFSCEDPRITKFGDRYFIFYTALSRYPFSADGIRVGLVITKDFKKLEKHPVTPFNSKAMALFPELINGKMAALLTVHTDSPPSKICLALFDKEEDIWSEEYWKQWHADLASHIIPIPRGDRDHIELGSPPIKTEKGWLFFYAYIDSYFSPPATFGVQALLVDANDPRKIVGAAKRPFFLPDKPYERQGRVSNIVFPSGAITKGEKLEMYYGGADTVSCVAELETNELIKELISVQATQLQRFEGNPIIGPVAAHKWESKATFNPTAVYESGKVHILYRAMGDDNTSVFGYAVSDDGLHIKERTSDPIYVPRADFEKKLNPGANSGCEDARITKLGERFYVCYTAYDSKDSPRVALSSITEADFIDKKWNWSSPILISPPGADDKDAALFPEKINGKYVFLHRLSVDIWIDYLDDLKFGGGRLLGGKVLMKPRDTSWDNKKIGIAGPPIKTEKGWLLIFHGISRRTNHYSLRAALLDLKNPSVVLGRTRDSILDPMESYEKQGIVPHVVFSCGAAVIKGNLFVYYGAADTVTGVATVPLQNILDNINF
jgi:predicted GH43/DUF377 family glycosyl hydrolase